MSVQTQLIIIGGGPAGLTAAIYAARAGLNPIVAAGNIRPGETPGGQLMITTEVENFPGFPNGISGPELIEHMKQQAENFGAVIIEEFAKFATDFKINDNQKQKYVVTIGCQTYETYAIILATGARARWLGLNDEEKFINKGISACATCDGPLPYFRNKPIVVIGGGDSACEEALFLAKFASEVFIIHRRDKLRASKIMTNRVLNHSKIKILWNTRVIEYYGDEFLRGVKIITDDEKDFLDCTGVFMAIGHIPNTEHIPEKLLDKDRYIKVSNNVYTDIPGVFAAGDCHDTIYRQAITASGFGCMASIAAERWLEENKSE